MTTAPASSVAIRPSPRGTASSGTSNSPNGLTFDPAAAGSSFSPTKLPSISQKRRGERASPQAQVRSAPTVSLGKHHATPLAGASAQVSRPPTTRRLPSASTASARTASGPTIASARRSCPSTRTFPSTSWATRPFGSANPRGPPNAQTSANRVVRVGLSNGDLIAFPECRPRPARADARPAAGSRRPRPRSGSERCARRGRPRAPPRPASRRDGTRRRGPRRRS